MHSSLFTKKDLGLFCFKRSQRLGAKLPCFQTPASPLSVMLTMDPLNVFVHAINHLMSETFSLSQCAHFCRTYGVRVEDALLQGLRIAIQRGRPHVAFSVEMLVQVTELHRLSFCASVERPLFESGQRPVSDLHWCEIGSW